MDFLSVRRKLFPIPSHVRIGRRQELPWMGRSINWIVLVCRVGRTKMRSCQDQEFKNAIIAGLPTPIYLPVNVSIPVARSTRNEVMQSLR